MLVYKVLKVKDGKLVSPLVGSADLVIEYKPGKPTVGYKKTPVMAFRDKDFAENAIDFSGYDEWQIWEAEADVLDASPAHIWRTPYAKRVRRYWNCHARTSGDYFSLCIPTPGTVICNSITLVRRVARTLLNGNGMNKVVLWEAER